MLGELESRRVVEILILLSRLRLETGLDVRLFRDLEISLVAISYLRLEVSLFLSLI